MNKGFRAVWGKKTRAGAICKIRVDFGFNAHDLKKTAGRFNTV